MMRRAVTVVVLLLALTALVAACASTPKARYYQNLDMYTFVGTEVQKTYAASTPEERAVLDRDLLPLLSAWGNARRAWKLSLTDSTKEQAAMLAWSQVRSALITLGIFAVGDLEKAEKEVSQ